MALQTETIQKSLIEEEASNIASLPSSRARSNSDPTHKNVIRPRFATGLVHIMGDERAHGMMRENVQNKPAHEHALSEVPSSSSNLFGIFLLCSVSLGVGVFVLPSVLNSVGIGPGVLMLAGYGFLALYTQLIILECAHRSNVNGYEQMASHSMGKIGEFLLAFFMAISLLTGNCGHIATVGQLLHDIIEWFFTGEYGSDFSWKKTIILYAVMLSLTLPWLFQRSLHGLSGVGTLSVMVVLMTAASLTFVCFGKLINGDGASDAKGNAPIYGFEKVTNASFWVTDFWLACPVLFICCFYSS